MELLSLETIILQISSDFVEAFLKTLPLWLTIILAVVIIFLWAGKYIENWINLFRKEKINFTASRAERRTSSNIRERLNESRGQLSDQFKFDVLPLDFEIQWHSKSTRPHINNDDKIIIVLDDKNKNFSENFAIAVYQYSSQGVLPNARKYISEDVTVSIDLTMTKKILNTQKQDALEYFDENIYQDEMKKRKSVGDFFQALSTLDYHGLFTRLFLKELYEFGKRLHPTIPNKFIKEETKRYMEYFEEIAHRPLGKDILTDSMKGANIQIGVVFIAGDYLAKNKINSILHPEKTPYGRHIKDLMHKGINSIYLLGRGKEFVSYTKILISHFKGYKEVDHTDLQQYKFTKDLPAIVGLIRLKTQLR